MAYAPVDMSSSRPQFSSRTRGSVRLLAAICLGGIASCAAQPAPDDVQSCGNCDDGNVCTVDGCNELRGECIHDQPSDQSCDDGNSCTTGDTCATGTCVGKGEVACDDDQPCTNDGCDPTSGCTHVANSNACDDANACSTEDKCLAGKCVGDTPLSCDDGNNCTADTCDKRSGCAYSDEDKPCDDENACTKPDLCVSGACKPGEQDNCDDGNGCTKDTCDPSSGCANTQLGTFPCEDGDNCTVADVCDKGACKAGEVKECDDGDPCTLDEKCVKGACDSGKAKECADANPCTTDDCLPETGCKFVGLTGAGCDDSNACTVKDICAFGTCLGNALVCDDANQCTDDACSPDKGCLHTANQASCSDGNKCTEGDICANGSCAAGPPLGCNSCGNGLVEGPSGAAPASCDTAAGEVKVGDFTGLKAWASKANRPLRITADVKLIGPIHIDTPCAVHIGEKASLSSNKGGFIGASNLTVDGQLDVKGKLVLRASKELVVSKTASLPGDATEVAVEASKATLSTGLSFGSSLCIDAVTVALGAETALGVTKLSGTGSVEVNAKSDVTVVAGLQTKAPVKIYAGGDLVIGKGSFLGSGALELQAGFNLTCAADLGSIASLKATAAAELKWDVMARALIASTATLQADESLRLLGVIVQGAQFLGVGKRIEIGGAAELKGSGGIDLAAKGNDVMQFNGRVSGASSMGLTAHRAHFGEKAVVSNGGNIIVIANDKITVDGIFKQNKTVLLQAKALKISHKDAFTGNKTCSLKGELSSDSVTSGCKAI